MFVGGCVVYYKAKDYTPKQPGLLVPMPIPEQHLDVQSMDFKSGLPSSQGYNTIYTCYDKFKNFLCLIPCFKGEGALSALECANLFFSTIVRLFVVPKMVFYDRNSRFTSNFWKVLWGLLETKVLFTSTYNL